MFRFVDLFAGIGGVRLGLEAAGGQCVASVEIDRFARLTYEANFEPVEYQDIREVVSLPAHDLLAAGFPCQPFSLAGVSKKLSLGRQHGFRDATQGTLFFEVARLVEKSRPRVILLENVKHLVSHDRGRTFSVIRQAVEELGYTFSYKVIDAQPWVPQHRERVFIVGLRRDSFGDKTFVFPDVPDSSHSLGEVLQPAYDSKYVLSEHLWKYLRDYAEKHRARGNGFGFSLFGPADVARTLSARYHKDGSEILIRTQDGAPPRRLTPRECAGLMGFPVDFEIVVSDTQAYRQFGNSVVVPVVSHVAVAVVEQAGLRRRAARAS